MPLDIDVKGLQDGLLITLPGDSWVDVEKALFEKLGEEDSFFKGARVALQVGSRVLRAAELGRLRDSISDLDLNLWAVLSDDAATREASQALGLATSLTKTTTSPVVPELDVVGEEGHAMLVRQTLRSGRSLEYRGHVVVLGDVNPGAEVVALGNVIVWGRLNGVVHAGAEGDSSAVVCALDLAPTQLRIDSLITRSPRRGRVPEPELAYIRDGQIVAERWAEKGKNRRKYK